MMRRIGETMYRADSPCSYISHHNSEVSLPSVDYTQDDDQISCNTLIADKWSHHDDDNSVNRKSSRSSKHSKTLEVFERIVSREEVTKTEKELCKKLSLIVDLVSDFTNDASRLYESADELLKELRQKIRVYIYLLDIEMSDTEKLLRFNVDRSTICDDRIDWLLHYTKCHKEMRRVLTELSEQVCDDLENCLELRAKGIIGKKPSIVTINTLSSMRDGMETASRILGVLPRQRA